MQTESDKEILNELRAIQKDNGNWKNDIHNVAEKLNEKYCDEVKSKALWVIGEIGLRYPSQAEEYIGDIVKYLDDENPKLRERAVNALGRIGRGDSNLIIPFLDRLMQTSRDDAGEVRLSFVWACENISANSPELFCDKLDLFYEMISDSHEKVRMESPEMFRVIGKRKPQYVKPYLDRLQWIAQHDEHRVVRIHCAGAVRVTKKALDEKLQSSKQLSLMKQ